MLGRRSMSSFVALLLTFELLIGVASLTLETFTECPDVNKLLNGAAFVYTRDELLKFSEQPLESTTDLNKIQEESKTWTRRRGKRGGIRTRCRKRGCRVPVPRIVTGNVRSLRNKIDELAGLTRWNYAYRESSLICLTETWLQTDKDPDTAFTLDGFTLFRGDRSEEESGKSQGGGVCAYVNNKWCKNISVYGQYCCKDIEFLTLSLRPFYVPREFTKIFVTTVYIPPSADVKVAESILYAEICKTENDNPDAVKIITGDFNNCDFGKCVPTYTQFVNFATREDKLLDPFFCNVKNSYMARKLSPLGISDHLMCHMVPVYKQIFKRYKPTEKTVYKWDDDVNNTLLACMECTDFDVLYDNDATIDENVDVLTSYIHFCTEMIVPKRTVKCFPNNKPWVTKDLKELLNRKKQLIATNDRTQLKDIQKIIDRQIDECKQVYKKKVENMFKSDTKSAWSGLKQLTGMKKNPIKPDVNDINKFCNELNVFYGRFDKYDFYSLRSSMVDLHNNALSDADKIVITEDDVLKSLSNIKTGKAAGPDKINGNILKLCKATFTPILSKIFQQSVDSVSIPVSWKTSEIIPLPKKPSPLCNNDYRPVALTSIIMKCLERIIKNLLCEQVKTFTDCYQFAYTKNRCVEDATLSLTEYVLNHVDQPNQSHRSNFVKILFVDFSSAFNTIQPHLMMNKLNEMNVNPYIILWINEFLTCRPQYVKYLGTRSEIVVTNTGAPQGCVLSPVLFTIYTSECKSTSNTTKLFKYADDTALVSRCVNNDNMYKNEVELFVKWCTDNYLELNVKKTKEMIVDFRKLPADHAPLLINNEIVECVHEYKYLGTIIDDKFNFNLNVTNVYKKVLSRMYFLRQLKKLRIDDKILDLFYTAIVQSVISFSIVSWVGNCNIQSKDKLNRIITNCVKLGIKTVTPLSEIYIYIYRYIYIYI